ncbi:hypothetical protein RvY_01679-2 [Ramazzottius varieornatus]|nr:hypothetical protein RvY_01679-2 [Ramazzottius varieornatus]
MTTPTTTTPTTTTPTTTTPTTTTPTTTRPPTTTTPVTTMPTTTTPPTTTPPTTTPPTTTPPTTTRTVTSPITTPSATTPTATISSTTSSTRTTSLSSRTPTTSAFATTINLITTSTMRLSSTPTTRAATITLCRICSPGVGLYPFDCSQNIARCANKPNNPAICMYSIGSFSWPQKDPLTGVWDNKTWSAPIRQPQAECGNLNGYQDLTGSPVSIASRMNTCFSVTDLFDSYLPRLITGQMCVCNTGNICNRGVEAAQQAQKWR